LSKLDWERRGPPRQGSSSVDHPVGIERPYIHRTDEQKRARRQELEDDAKARGLAIRAAEWEARFGKPYPFSYR